MLSVAGSEGCGRGMLVDNELIYGGKKDQRRQGRNVNDR